MPALAPIRVVLPVRDERDLAEKFGEHIGPGGVRLFTGQPRSPGEVVAFELCARDGTVLFQGAGAVVKALRGQREDDLALLVRYQRLDGADRAALDRILLMKRGVTDLALATSPPTEPGVVAAPPRAPLGLDVGGTFARAAIMKGGRPVLVNVAPGNTALPAAVALDDKDRLVLGARARAQRAIDAQSGLASPLPLLLLDPRRAGDDAELSRLPFNVRDGEGGPVAELPHHAMPAVELFAAVVGELRSRAQDAAGQPLVEAHLAVPSTLDMRAKHLLQLGLRHAGFSSPVLVDAALAAAAHHGLPLDARPPGPILVVDWGGTTLQLAVLDDVDGRLDVLAAGQKRHLGGTAIDERIARTLLESVEGKLGAKLTDPLARQRLLDAAEGARVSLASQREVHVRIPFLAMSDDGHPVDLDVKLDAAPTLRALEPALDQLLRVALAVLESLELEPSQVHQVLLVGGQCAWPRVRERLESRFPGKVVAPNQPAAAVAMGTARIAAQKQRAGGDAVSQKLQEPVSVMGAGGKLLRLFDRGAVLPARAELKLRVGPGAGLICPVVEGAALANGRGYLGAVALAGAEREVQLSAQIDARRILDVDLSCGTLHAHGRFPLQSAAAGIAASVFAQAPLPGEREPTPTSALGHGS
ncbi:MAG: Hsp70 family protein [Deltaproteobacteria bacterium]|nr:Hsp70 family protein [Deltaproteobacteria bacterium]